MEFASRPGHRVSFLIACMLLTSGCRPDDDKKESIDSSAQDLLQIDIPIEEPEVSWRELEAGIDTNRATQRDLNLMSYVAFLKEQERMNSILLNIRQEYAGDTLFLTALGNAQHAWIRYRDAHLNARFPSHDGSASAMCRTTEKAALTRSRIKELRMWLKEIDGKDICTGSYRLRPSADSVRK